MVFEKKINVFDQEDEGHQFAFYYLDHVLLKQLQGAEVTIKDEAFVHRIVRIVKLKPGEKFIIFDQKRHVLVELIDCLRHEIKVNIVSGGQNLILQPKITWLLPLLKKEALEGAVYSLAELGVNEIQLVVTAKSRKSLMDKEIARLKKIIIAAAEQSKHYAFPSIYPAKSLQQSVNDLALITSDKIVYDISGKSFFELREKMTFNSKSVVVGPEGGFIAQELFLLKEHGFNACSLTPTVLRAMQAVAVGAAMLRI